MNNWNNRPARGFPAADDQWSYGSIRRVELLNDNTAKVRKHTLATLTGAMNAAATQDVRVMKLVPLLARALKGGTPPSARAKRMLELLEEWRAQEEAGSTATSTARSTIRARRSSTPRGTG